MILDFENLLEITASFTPDDPPARVTKICVQEKNTGKICGFIKLASPLINARPRNNWLGRPLNGQDKVEMRKFNDSTIMGFVIVPAQPFGFNYLGGKLLAAICCSHTIREKLNNKYGMNLSLFETTSLYGNSKSSSQYDGMKPYLRYKGLTDSDFIPLIHGKPFHDLATFVDSAVGKLVKDDASSRKLKLTNAIIGLIKRSLNKSDLERFNTTISNAKKLTERKRYYVSDYGIKNYLDIVKDNTKKIVKGDNWDKFHLNNIIDWWKKKAESRYNKLKEQNRLRTELEIWTPEAKIDIIR